MFPQTYPLPYAANTLYSAKYDNILYREIIRSSNPNILVNFFTQLAMELLFHYRSGWGINAKGNRIDESIHKSMLDRYFVIFSPTSHFVYI